MSQDVFQFKIDESHNSNLHSAMERTRETNLCLNYKKLVVKQDSVKFFGNIYSKEGVSADPEKVKAIHYGDATTRDEGRDQVVSRNGGISTEVYTSFIRAFSPTS